MSSDSKVSLTDSSNPLFIKKPFVQPDARSNGFSGVTLERPVVRVLAIKSPLILNAKRLSLQLWMSEK